MRPYRDCVWESELQDADSGADGADGGDDAGVERRLAGLGRGAGEVRSGGHPDKAD